MMVAMVVHFSSQESLVSKASRIQLSGQVSYILSNMYKSQLTLAELSVDEQSNLIRKANLATADYTIISSVFTTTKKDLMFALAKTNDQNVVLVTLKNEKVMSLQKVNAINAKKIKLQYGEIVLPTSAKPELIADDSDTAIVL